MDPPYTRTLRTPLAGVELDRHYAYQVCTPTRMSFLSGRLPVHTPFGLGNYCNAKEGIPREMQGC